MSDEEKQDILIATLTDIKEMQRQLHERIDAISQRVDGISEEYSATLGGYEDAVQRILFLEAEVDGLPAPLQLTGNPTKVLLGANQPFSLNIPSGYIVQVQYFNYKGGLLT